MVPRICARQCPLGVACRSGLAAYWMQSWMRPGAVQVRDASDLASRLQNRNAKSLLLGVDKLSRRPPRHIFDVTSPTNSYLLDVTLNKHLPPSTLSTEYGLNHGRHPLAPLSRLSLPMTQGHHLVYFPTPISPADLESDGTDPYHSPGGGFTRRVWAGGSINFTRDNLQVDSTQAVCVETVEKVETKGVNEDTKIYLHLLRRYMPMDMSRPGRFDEKNTNCLTEKRVLAFMKALPKRDPFSGALKSEGSVEPQSEMASRIIKAPWKPDALVETVITPEMLFYFSALTMNAHAIHLNIDRARRVEGHKGLLIHGPFCVVLMLNVVRSLLATGHNSEAVKFFEYRNFAPLYAGTRIQICVSTATAERKPEYLASHRRTIWIEDEHGSLCVKATAYIGPKKGVKPEEIPEYVPPASPPPLPEWVGAPAYESMPAAPQREETDGFTKHPTLRALKQQRPPTYTPRWLHERLRLERSPYPRHTGSTRSPAGGPVRMNNGRVYPSSYTRSRPPGMRDSPRYPYASEDEDAGNWTRSSPPPHRRLNPVRERRNRMNESRFEDSEMDNKFADQFSKRVR